MVDLIQSRLSQPPAMWASHQPAVCFSLSANSAVPHYSLAALVALIEKISDLLNTLKSEREASCDAISVLLFQENSFHMSAALLAANICGVKVVLPANCQADYLLSLELSVDCAFVDSSCFEVIEPLLVPSAGFVVDVAHLQIDERSDGSQCAALPLQKSGELVLFTSGSSGKPETIVKKWQHLFDEVLLLEQSFSRNISAQSLFYATVSHQHIYGLLFRLLWPLLSGRTFQDLSAPYPEALIGHATTQQLEQSVLVSSPAQLVRWIEHSDFSQLVACVQTLFSSGGPLSDEAASELSNAYKLPAIEVYGSTETGGIAWRRRCIENKFSSAWQVFKGIEIQQQDNSCLSIKSPFVPSYLCNADGYYLSQDKVSLLALVEDGEQAYSHFELLGRADRVVKLEEKRLSLTDVERVLAASQWVSRAKALIIRQAGKRDALSVAVELNAAGLIFLKEEGKPSLVKALKTLALKTFERVLLPRKWRFVESLPVNEQSKTTQGMLEALFIKKPALKNQEPLIDMFKVPSLSVRDTPFAAIQFKTYNEHTIICGIELPLTDDLFDAHFHEIALLPGVIQVDWAMQLAGAWFQASAFLGVQRFKFKNPMLPGHCVQLVLSCSRKTKTKIIMGKEKTAYVVKFEYRKLANMSAAEATTVFSSGQILFDANTEESCDAK